MEENYFKLKLLFNLQQEEKTLKRSLSTVDGTGS